MFEIGFSELMVVMAVALIVIGPERLPKVARTAGHLWGRMQRHIHSIKNDIANDLAAEEVNRLHDTIRKEATSIERSAHEARLALEQKILDAQMGRSPDAPGEPNGHGKCVTADNETRHARFPHLNPLDETTSHSTRLQTAAAKSLVIPQAGEEANESLREIHVKAATAHPPATPGKPV